MVKLPTTALPGQAIVPILLKTKNAKYLAGNNCRIETIELNGSEIPSIVSSIVGNVKITKSDSKDKYDSYTVDVISKHDPTSQNKQSKSMEIRYGIRYASVSPKLNDLVLARVTKVLIDRINMEIISIDNSKDDDTAQQLLQANLAANENGEKFKGVIRSVDVRSVNRDQVNTWDCFQPGDIVRAEVISLGDGINYYLSTAKDYLGVVLARSFGDANGMGSGKIMYALDWETMVVSETGNLEKRKCAKPF